MAAEAEVHLGEGGEAVALEDVDEVGRWIDVDESWRDPLPQKRMGCGDKGVGGDDNLSRQSKLMRCNLKTYGRIANQNTMSYSEVF